MTEELNHDEVSEFETQEPGGLFERLPWWLIGTIAVIAAEVTAHPSVGIVLACLKFGWNDFQTALWLWSRDPNAQRGFTCACFFLSSGLWRVCLRSFLFIGAFVMFIGLTSMLGIQPLALLAEGAQRRSEIEFFTNASVWLSSCAVATTLTLASTPLAIRCRTKIWVSSSISDSRRRNEWPPRITRNGLPETNRLPSWIMATAIATFIPPLLFGVWSLLSSNPGTPSDHAGAGAVVKTMATGFLPFFGIIFVVPFAKAVSRRLAASCVAECWPDDEPSFESSSSG